MIGTNKIRMDYIESQMAKRHERDTPSDTRASKPNDDEMSSGGLIKGTPGDQFPERQPASLGKLHEIDLGPDAKLRNIARTEAAAKRLVGDESPLPEGEEEDEEEETSKMKKKQPRLGKDGKPWRGRKRRNSEDIKRDQLVEEVMRESKREYIVLVYKDVKLTDSQQWKCMMSRKGKKEGRMTRRRMTGSRRSSDGTLWRRSRHDDGGHGHDGRPRGRAAAAAAASNRGRRRHREGRSWGAAGAHGRRCGRVR